MILPLFSKDSDEIVWDYCAMFYKFTSNTTYWEHLRLICKYECSQNIRIIFRGMFLPVPSPHQGWFLCYLFVYSQLLVHLFIAVHPNHQVRNKPKWLTVAMPLLETSERLESVHREMKLWLMA